MTVICISLFFSGCFFPPYQAKMFSIFFFFFMLHKNPLSTVQTGHYYCERGPADTFSSAHIGSKKWFITANPPVSLIEHDNVKTEARTQDFALWAAWAERCCRAGLAQKPQQKRRPPPTILLFKKPSPSPSPSFAPSRYVSLSVTAPDGLLFSGCSLTSILRVTSFFSSSVDLSPVDSLSTVNSSLFQLCLQPALWVWLTTLVLSPPQTCSRWTPFFRAMLLFPLMHAVSGSNA